LIFLGKPIDYIHFGEDKVTFIEVKSGNSRLTKTQRRIKGIIKNKEVEWHEVRVKRDSSQGNTNQIGSIQSGGTS